MGTDNPIELSERFATFIKFLDDRKGSYQRTRDVLAGELGLTMHHTRVLVDRAEELGILDVERTGHPMIGHGRFANTYTLKITHQQFMAHRIELHAAYVAKRAKTRAREARKLRKQMVRVLPDEMTVPTIEPAAFREQTDDLEIAAWQDFGDF